MAVREWLDLMERAWNAADHPRGPDGRFLGKGGAKSKSAGTSRPRDGKPSDSASGSEGKSGDGKPSPAKTPAKKDTAKPPAKATPKAPAKSPAEPKAADPPPGPAPKPKDKAFLDSHYAGWKDKLTPAQEKAMRFYQSPGFALMNGQLRGLDKGDIKADVTFDDADLERARKASKDLHSAIRKAPPLEEPMTVYRGFSADQFGDLKPGMRIADKGFTSTSITNDVGSVGRATKQATAEIVLPAGTKAAAGSSRELVLPPGSKFRVASVATRKGVPHVRLELIL
jgi:hypothetical protein